MISIVSWRPEWPGEFLGIGTSLRKALGELAVRIDHVGSTAVPGLGAKDVIDIQITVTNLQPAIEQALSRIGYDRIQRILGDHLPPNAVDRPGDWTKWVFMPAGDRRATNIHVRVAGKPNQRYPLLFRDYLRAHATAAQAYERVKTALARLHPQDTDAYYEVKDPVCDIVMAAAEAWATAIEWQPGPSDC